MGEISAIEYLRDRIRCVLGERNYRLVFLLRDPLQVGMYVPRAVQHLNGR